MLFENMSGTWVKICGIRQPEHARLAVEYGADAIGMMFYEPSPRHLSLEEGKVISEAVAGKAVRIAVVVNPSQGYLQQILDTVEPDAIQFHGDEDNAFCNCWNLPWLKAVRVRDDMDVARQLEKWPDASAYVLDAYTPDVYGGTGEAFDWDKFPKHVNRPLMLAGGLKVDNVAQAVVTINPWAIDVSSGVESSRGVKDEALIRGFMQEVNNVRTQVR